MCPLLLGMCAREVILFFSVGSQLNSHVNCVFCAGSAGGLAKNFATLVEVLGEFGEVTKPQQEQGATAVRTLSPLGQAALNS